jgi:regulator of nucleoside diphosphate kinase
MRAMLTDLDMLTLGDCVEGRLRWPGEDREHIEALRRKANGARVVPSDDIPADVVTLHSRVRVMDLDRACDAIYTVVPGAQGSISSNTIPVMTSIGVALLGRREGDEIACWLDGGARRLRIEEVIYQPEAAARRISRERIVEQDPA